MFNGAKYGATKMELNILKVFGSTVLLKIILIDSLLLRKIIIFEATILEKTGISTTQCDFWCFIDSNNKTYFIELSKLKSLCKFKKEIQTKCEDSCNRIYLVRMSNFSSHSISINKMLI